MRIDERAARMMRLMEYLNEQERAVPVSELAELAMREYGVSEVTLRSDLAALSSLREVRKLARGMYQTAPRTEPARPGEATLFSTRLLHRAESKIAIAAEVAARLRKQEDLRVLLLDAGTTTYYVADRLSESAGLDLIIWTPSVAAAARLAGTRGVSVRLLGGEYQPDYAVVSGDETARALRALAGVTVEVAEIDSPLPQFPGTHCVLDVNYVATDGRLYTDESKERLQKRLMSDLAEDITIVADHTKLFARRLGLQPHEVYALQQFREKRWVHLITDTSTGEDARETAREVLATAFPDRTITVEVADEAVILTAGRQNSNSENDSQG